jgi:hypothetical protein
MRSNVLHAVAVLLALGTPIASASAAFAYAGDNYDYARDSWPQIQTWMQAQNQQILASAPALTRSDATPGGTVHNAPVSGGSVGAVRDDTGIVHYGSDNPLVSRYGQY